MNNKNSKLSNVMNTSFAWDEEKNVDNLRKHGVDFGTAQYAFIDSNRIRIIGAGYWRKGKSIYEYFATSLMKPWFVGQ